MLAVFINVLFSASQQALDVRFKPSSIYSAASWISEKAVEVWSSPWNAHAYPARAASTTQCSEWVIFVVINKRKPTGPRGRLGLGRARRGAGGRRLCRPSTYLQEILSLVQTSAATLGGSGLLSGRIPIFACWYSCRSTLAVLIFITATVFNFPPYWWCFSK